MTREGGCTNTRLCVAAKHLRLGSVNENVIDRDRDSSFKRVKLRWSSGKFV